MKNARPAAMLLFFLALAGCRSRVVQVNLINTSQQPIKTIIVDYPGATFGVDSLAPGKTFLYTIKPLETGALKIQFTDAQGVNHRHTGPTLHKNNEGSIRVKLTQDSATSEPTLM